MTTNKTRFFAFLPLLALLGALLGTACGSESLGLDVTIEVEAALKLDTVTLAITTPGKAPFERTFASAPVINHTVEITGVSAGASVVIEARGNRGGAVVETKRQNVAVSRHAHVTFQLTADCANVTCAFDETCTAGRCAAVLPPIRNGGASGRDGGAGTGGAGPDGGGATGGAPTGGSGGSPNATGGSGGSGTGGSGTGGSAGSGAGGARTGGSNGGTGGSATGGQGGGTGGLATGGQGGGGAKRALGQTCTAAGDCASGFCADGVCCNSACNGSCAFCAGATPGTCSFVTGAPKTGHTACGGVGSCAGTCNGMQAACSFPAAETTCQPQSCTGSTQTNAATCDGTGKCATATTKSCAPYTCSGTACASGCATGAALCSGQCVNTSTDAANCGDCGKSCFGGTCSAGKCQRTAVATGAVEALVLSGTIYYITQSATGSQVSKVASTAAPGTMPTVLATINGEGCGRLAVDASTGDVFFVCGKDLSHYVRRVTPAGAVTTIRTLAQYQNPILMPLNGKLYWWDQSNPGDIDQSTADGMTAVGNLVSFSETVSTVASDTTNLFALIGVAEVDQVNIAKEQSSTLWTNNVGATSSKLLSDGSYLYFDDAGVGLWRVPKDVSTMNATKVVNASTLVDFGAPDATNIYFATAVAASNGAGCSSYQIQRTAKAGGGQPASVYSGTASCARNVTGGDLVVAWIEFANSCEGSVCTSGTLYKLAK